MSDTVEEKVSKILCARSAAGITDERDAFISSTSEWASARKMPIVDALNYFFDLASVNIPMPWEPGHKEKRLAENMRRFGEGNGLNKPMTFNELPVSPMQRAVTLIERYRSIPGNENGGNLALVFADDAQNQPTIRACRRACQILEDTAGVELADLLLSLTHTHRRDVCKLGFAASDKNPLEFWVAYQLDREKKHHYLGDGKGNLRLFKTLAGLQSYLEKNLTPEQCVITTMHPVQGKFAVPESDQEEGALVPISTLGRDMPPTAQELLTEKNKKGKR